MICGRPADYWQGLALHPFGGCAKHCPYCYVATAGHEEQPLDFFSHWLEVGQAIPQWYFSLDDLPDLKLEAGMSLIRQAWAMRHSYRITSNYENVFRLDPAVFQRSDQISLSLDDYKVKDMGCFFKALSQLQDWQVRTAVMVTMTMPMIQKLQSTDWLHRLLATAHKVCLIWPKVLPVTSLPGLQEMVAWIAARMLKFGIYEKLVMDPCLAAQLPLWRQIAGPQCPYQRVLSIMPDGSARICPYQAAENGQQDACPWQKALPSALQERRPSLC